MARFLTNGAASDDARNAFMLITCIYAWQVHNIWIGLGVLIGILLVVPITNVVIVKTAPINEKQPFVWLRANSWFWVTAALFLVAISGDGGADHQL